MFWRRPYNRTSTLAAADKARSRGRVRKAISGYSKVVENEPNDYQVHARLAPLLAKVRRWEDSRKSFHAAGDGFLAAGFADKAVAIWTMAAQHFPEDVPYWERIANEQVKRGRKADAVHTLMQGRGQLRSSFQRPMAIQLLEQVLVLDPHHFDATLDLVRLLRIEGQRPKAEKLLSELARDAVGPRVRRIRAAQFRLSPGFRTFFAWVLGRKFEP
jgi:tetratricopeptide (TPR) repeat protein